MTLQIGLSLGQEDWSVQTTNTLRDFSAAAWSGEALVAVGQGGLVMTSPDGVSWTSRDSTTPNFLTDVAWSGERFVAVGEGSRPIITSPDGISWSITDSVTSYELFNGIAWSGERFVAVGLLGLVMTSQDGLEWTRRQSGTLASLFDVAWTGSRFVAAGQAGTVLTSINGFSWTEQDSTVTENLLSVASNGSTIVCGGNSGTTISSANGVEWNYQYSGYPLDITGIASFSEKFAAVAWNFAGCVVLSRDDGGSWSQSYSETNQLPRDIVSTGSRLVAVGDGGLVLTSEISGPSIRITREDGQILIEYTGILQRSGDLDVWSDVSPQPPSPFVVSESSGEMFFRSK